MLFIVRTSFGGLNDEIYCAAFESRTRMKGIVYRFTVKLKLLRKEKWIQGFTTYFPLKVLTTGL